ncbi:MAG: RNA methyltransferase [Alcaligenaceae bacterium]|nr:RNA methyltransferase [Alcaligenaceae bacterium]
MTNPSHPGNVGAAARAVKNMGFDQLRLVKPRFDNITRHEDAVAFASGAQDVLSNSKEFSEFSEAFESVTLSFALTARPRDMGPNCVNIRAAAQLARAHLAADSHHQIAVVFGTERTGLSNEQISHCHYICYIPANPEYSSLNVAQAMQLVAWELRYALIEQEQHLLTQEDAMLVQPAGDPNFPAPPLEPLAPQEQVEALLEHWQEALERIDFIDPARPKKTMLKMRYWLMRSRLTQNECDMMRGVCTQILKHNKPSS